VFEIVRSWSWFICIALASMGVILVLQRRTFVLIQRRILKCAQQNLVYRCVNLHSILGKVILLTSQISSFYCQCMKPVTFSFHYTVDKKIYNIPVWRYTKFPICHAVKE